MKIALITDTHYNFKKANKNFHEFFGKFYSNVFFPYLKKHNIRTVIHCGDAFDSRKGIDYWALEWAKENVYDKFKANNIEVYGIVGNHDTYYKNTNSINSVDTLLNEYSNVVKISSPKEVSIDGTKILFIPWICSENEKEIFDLIEKTDSKILCGHLELSGFPVYPGQVQPNGISKDIFKKFDRVFSGHYHTRSDDGKIFYLGNPYQMFWNDYDDQRGFNIFDTETYKLEHIKNPYTIFEKIYYEDTDIRFLDEIDVTDKFVKLIVKKKTNQKQYDKFVDKLSQQKCLEIKISEILDIDDTNFQYQDCEVEDTLTTLDRYIDESEFNLDKKISKQIIRDLYSQALEVE